jgi:hypothetical protein
MWKIIAIVSFILMAGLFSLEYYLDRELTLASGYNSVSLQFKTDAVTAEKILLSWNADMRTKTEAVLAIDFAFMFLGYGLFFFAVSRLLDSNILSLFAFLPVVFDSAENFLHLAAIQGNRPELVTASFHVTLFKFLCILAYLVLFIAVAVAKLAGGRKKDV